MKTTLGRPLVIVGIAMLAGCSSNKHQGTRVAHDSGYRTYESVQLATSHDHDVTPAYERSGTATTERSAVPYAPIAPRETVYSNPGTTVQSNTRATLPPVAMKPSRSDINFDELRGHVRNQSAVIVDARQPKDFRKGHVAGAINMPAGDEDAYLPKFQKDVPSDQLVVVYCGGPDCPAGDNVVTYLSSQGYTNLRVYKPGWQHLSKTDLH